MASRRGITFTRYREYISSTRPGARAVPKSNLLAKNRPRFRNRHGSAVSEFRPSLKYRKQRALYGGDKVGRLARTLVRVKTVTRVMFLFVVAPMFSDGTQSNLCRRRVRTRRKETPYLFLADKHARVDNLVGHFVRYVRASIRETNCLYKMSSDGRRDNWPRRIRQFARFVRYGRPSVSDGFRDVTRTLDETFPTYRTNDVRYRISDRWFSERTNTSTFCRCPVSAFGKQLSRDRAQTTG